jgi:hypothetical protein
MIFRSTTSGTAAIRRLFVGAANNASASAGELANNVSSSEFKRKCLLRIQMF